MKALITTFFATLFLMVAAPAQATVLFEPYIGYFTGEWKQSTNKQDVTGMGYGARIGEIGANFMGGVDYLTGAWTDDSEPTKYDITPSILCAFIGYKFQNSFRVYVGYAPELINPSMRFEAGSAKTKYEGSVIKFALSFLPTDKVSINLEYMMATFGEGNGQELTNDLKVTTYSATLGLPFTF